MNEPLARLDLIQQPDHHTIATLTGEVDLTNADQIQRQLTDATEHTNTLTVDLTAVEYLDSQGVRILQHLTDRHRNGNLRLTIITAPASIAHDILTITHIPHTFVTDLQVDPPSTPSELR